MLPWGHAAVGYLLYSLGLRQRGQLPGSPEVFLLALGTQFPDLVDKPLAWELGLLESGRTLGHSLLIPAVVVALLYRFVAPRVGRSKVTAFAVGYLSHPLADLPFADLARGDLEFTTYLVWPLLPLPPYEETGRTIVGYLLAYEPGAADTVQLVLVAGALGLWYLDGVPGWRELTGWIRGRSVSEAR